MLAKKSSFKVRIFPLTTMLDERLDRMIHPASRELATGYLFRGIVLQPRKSKQMLRIPSIVILSFVSYSPSALHIH